MLVRMFTTSLKDLMNFTPQLNFYQQNLTSLSNNLSCDIFPDMIKTHVRKVAEMKGITTAYKLQKALDISPSVAARLWRDEFEFISRGSLNRLCKLLHCQPSKLITFEADK
jgi:DNA-binding Xre family transcriptional regulator